MLVVQEGVPATSRANSQSREVASAQDPPDVPLLTFSV
jgi:hypothetical protein